MDKKEMDKKKEIQNMERDERFVKRIQLKEAAEDEKKDTSTSKKPRLDLLNLLNPTASVLDILTASGGKPLPTLSSEDQINKETDTGNRPGVLDIFEPLPKEVPAEDKEAMEVGLNFSLFFVLFRGKILFGLFSPLDGNLQISHLSCQATELLQGI